MKKVFVDTNILLDVFLNRESFAEDAVAIFSDCESGKIKGFVSAISLNNLHYILSRYIGKGNALEAVRIVLNLFTVVSLDYKLLHLAADMTYPDFEDAIQYHSALQVNADCIITRDVAHFPKDGVIVMMPCDYSSSN
jgi:predicted nucleic acid-binding protein